MFIHQAFRRHEEVDAAATWRVACESMTLLVKQHMKCRVDDPNHRDADEQVDRHPGRDSRRAALAAVGTNLIEIADGLIAFTAVARFMTVAVPHLLQPLPDFG